MNDDRARRGEGFVGPLLGFALGALVGGGLALLLAPASGEATRNRLGSAARRMGRDARHKFDEARETVSDAADGLGADVTSAIDAGREAFHREAGVNAGHVASRVAELLTPPSRTP